MDILTDDQIISAISTSVDIELIVTFLVAMFLIFLGVNEDVSSKQYQKKVLLTLYFLLFVIFYFFTDTVLGLTMFFGIWLISGLGLFQRNNISLEKELSITNIFLYIGTLWFYSAKTYILLICAIVIYAIYFLNNWLNVSFMDVSTIHIIAAIIITLFCIVHFIKNTLDYFAIKDWVNVTEEIKKGSQEQSLKIELLSFIYYVEDRHLFDRQSTVYGMYDIKQSLIKKTELIKNRISYRFVKKSSIHTQYGQKLKSITFNKLFLNARKAIKNPEKVKESIRLIFNQISKKIKKYTRGYSTLEQQITRSTFLEPGSFRYKIRRKLFVERTLNKAFVVAWRKAKVREYKKSFQKDAYKNLLWSIKYHYLRYYCIKILNNPKSVEQLIEQLSKGSRLSVSAVERIHQSYTMSPDKEIYEGKLKRIIENEKKYSIL